MTTKKTLLVVDDDPDFLPTLVDMVKQFVYVNIITAKDGEEAISAYKEHKPDLVLMDIVMPHDGISAFFAIKEFDPNAKVIFVSGYEPPDNYAKAKANCAIYLLKKPFTATFLKELISRHISQNLPCA